MNFTAKTPPLSSSSRENFARAAPLILLLPSRSKIMCTLAVRQRLRPLRRLPAEVPFHHPVVLHIILFGLTLAGLAVCARADERAGESTQKEATMTARGTFDVKVARQPQDDSAGGPFGRLFLDKQFHGDLKAASQGQMLAAGTAVEGSGGYVALELVTGVLNGKRGSFIARADLARDTSLPLSPASPLEFEIMYYADYTDEVD